ncbi:pyridoxamine 5'-phosphate oxidase family protein [Lysobacter solisilvae]|uniref:Pyridoxamine 5'-phosphate oxidase family protein n=1 Tax=Agrilutibacter solisilvae TaxID=2763317 RepID=A0A975AT91_9GAMM|nr:pyridoxamine 5'-phosphate oxidase family protein [Lysobacter solisilvae]
MASASKQTQQIVALMKGIDIAMFTTVGPDGYLVSRPLSTQTAEFDGERIWFFIQADSPKVEEIARHAKVNVAYASTQKNTYLSVAGRARVFRDQARIDSMWSDALKAYFPRGRTDPNLALLEVRVSTVEYWDGPSSALGKLVSFVIARVTRDEEVMGENRLLDLKAGGRRSRLPPSHKDAGPGAKAAARKTLTRRAGTAVTGKAAAKKTATKKAATRKAATKKTATKKTATKKTATKKAATRKAATEQAAARKSVTRKAASKKTARSRTAAKR